MKTVGDYEYDENEKLGQGAFGTVYKGRNKTKIDEVVAIKDVYIRSCENKELPIPIKREIEILQALSTTTHKNIVTLLDYKLQAQTVYFIMEFCRGGSLQEYLQIKETLDERTINIFLKQIAAGLKIAHEMNIIHRDLKPENILLCFDAPKYPDPNDITLKIADFGIGRFLRSDEVARTHCGSPQYMAPEIYLQRRDGYDYKVDLWSVGVIAYECLVGSLSKKSLISIRGFEMPENITPEFAHLLTGLLKNDENDRFTTKKFCDHPFFGNKQFCDHPFFGNSFLVCVIEPNNNRKMMHFKDNQSVDYLIDTICSNYSTNSEDFYLTNGEQILERGSGNLLRESGIVHGSIVTILSRLLAGYDYGGQVAADSLSYVFH